MTKFLLFKMGNQFTYMHLFNSSHFQLCIFQKKTSKPFVGTKKSKKSGLQITSRLISALSNLLDVRSCLAAECTLVQRFG